MFELVTEVTDAVVVLVPINVVLAVVVVKKVVVVVVAVAVLEVVVVVVVVFVVFVAQFALACKAYCITAGSTVTFSGYNKRLIKARGIRPSVARTSAKLKPGATT